MAFGFWACHVGALLQMKILNKMEQVGAQKLPKTSNDSCGVLSIKFDRAPNFVPKLHKCLSCRTTCLNASKDNIIRQIIVNLHHLKELEIEIIQIASTPPLMCMHICICTHHVFLHVQSVYTWMCTHTHECTLKHHICLSSPPPKVRQGQVEGSIPAQSRRGIGGTPPPKPARSR